MGSSLGQSPGAASLAEDLTHATCSQALVRLRTSPELNWVSTCHGF